MSDLPTEMKTEIISFKFASITDRFWQTLIFDMKQCGGFPGALLRL